MIESKIIEKYVQLIVSGDYYLAHMPAGSPQSKFWSDDISKATHWNLKLDDPTLVLHDTPKQFHAAKLVKVKITTKIEEVKHE